MVNANKFVIYSYLNCFNRHFLLFNVKLNKVFAATNIILMVIKTKLIELMDILIIPKDLNSFNRNDYLDLLAANDYRKNSILFNKYKYLFSCQ